MTVASDRGIWVISIDFELYWGLLDIYSKEQYIDKLSQERVIHICLVIR